VTSHDGFTLTDLVSYNEKHNEANREDDRDGDNENRSWNCGIEGPTEDVAIGKLRAQQKRNFIATLFLSQGVPMMLGGDELGRTQLGNNNAYCQDNRVSWIDWENTDARLLEFTRELIRFRREHPVCRRRRWFTGQASHAGGVKDIEWFRPDGAEMKAHDWGVAYAKTLGMFVNGRVMSELNQDGSRVTDDCFFLIFNAYERPMEFRLPANKWSRSWTVILDTTEALPKQGATYLARNTVPVAGRAMVVLQASRD
jgi:glycogen operon protein